MTAVAPDARRWLKRFTRRDTGGITLLCFHYAGGAAELFRPWPARLPAGVEPVAVQLPGRSDRFVEPPYRRMAPLIDDLITMVEPVLERPFACYGVSMGARVSWALAHELRTRAMPLPQALFVAASSAPRGDDGIWEWEHNPGGLAGYVHDMGGTPQKVLDNLDLLAGLLPTLEADLEVLSTHGFHPSEPLDVPIRAFAGTLDPEAGPERMDGWRAETQASFALDPVPGGHFFDTTGEHQVIDTIARDLLT